MPWIDTHAHLNADDFAETLPGVLQRATEAGVERILVIGTDLADSRRAVELARRYPVLSAVVGWQPNNLNDVAPGDFEQIVDLAAEAEVVAVGETGLDRYWKTVPFEIQEASFHQHLTLAQRLRKPVVIHCREAEADIVRMLEGFTNETGQPIAGVMHSFTGDEATAQRCLELGMHISFAGMVTFKKSQPLREVASLVPLDRLLVETDSPYLSPEPFRGKPNEPARVIHTGACLAQVKGITVEEMAATTTANAMRLFGI